MKIGVVYTTLCQEEGILVQKYAIEMGGAPQYFSKVSGSGVNWILLNGSDPRPPLQVYKTFCSQTYSTKYRTRGHARGKCKVRCGTSSIQILAHQNRKIAQSQSPAISAMTERNRQKSRRKKVFGLRNRSFKSQIASDFPIASLNRNAPLSRSLGSTMGIAIANLNWSRGSTGVQRYGCIPRSAANNLGQIPQKLGAPNPLF